MTSTSDRSLTLNLIHGFIVCALLHWQTGRVAADVCGTRFTDPVSSTKLAQVVLQGNVMAMNPDLSDARTRSANVSVMQVYKGKHILDGMGTAHLKMVKVTRFGEEDKDNCIASMEAMHTEKPHIFFLRQTSHRDMLQLSALPLQMEEGIDKRIRRSLCDTCVRPPHIRRIRCINCAVPPKVRKMRSKRVKEGKRVRLRCGASGKPDLTFSWFKDGVAVTSNTSGIAIKDKATFSVLLIRRVTMAHAGIYRCLVSNPVGHDEKIANLKVTSASRSGQGRSPSRACMTQVFCLNGGTCVYHDDTGDEDCRCPPGFTGIRCHIKTPEPILPPTDTDVTLVENLTGQSNSDPSNSHSDGGGKQQSQDPVEDSVHPNANTEPLNADSDQFHSPSEGEESQRHLTATPPSSANLSSAARPVEAVSVPVEEQNVTDNPNSAVLAPEDVNENRGEDAEESKNNREVSSEAERKHLKKRLKNRRLKIGSCPDKHFCKNGGRCIYIHKLSVVYCVCPEHFGGIRCETPTGRQA